MRPQAWAVVPKLAMPGLGKATGHPAVKGSPWEQFTVSPSSTGGYFGLCMGMRGHRSNLGSGFQPGGFSASSFPQKNPQGLWDYLWFGSLLLVLLALSPCRDTSLPAS